MGNKNDFKRRLSHTAGCREQWKVHLLPDLEDIDASLEDNNLKMNMRLIHIIIYPVIRIMPKNSHMLP